MLVAGNFEVVAGNHVVVVGNFGVEVAGNHEEAGNFEVVVGNHVVVVVGNFGVVADNFVEAEVSDKLLDAEQLVGKPHQNPKLGGGLVEGKDKEVVPEGVAQAFDYRPAKPRHQFAEPVCFYPANGLLLNV